MPAINRAITDLFIQTFEEYMHIRPISPTETGVSYKMGPNDLCSVLESNIVKQALDKAYLNNYEITRNDYEDIADRITSLQREDEIIIFLHNGFRIDDTEYSCRLAVCVRKCKIANDYTRLVVRLCYQEPDDFNQLPVLRH